MRVPLREWNSRGARLRGESMIGSRISPIAGAALLSVAVAGAAQAGYWEAVYDFAPASMVETTNPGGVYLDPLSGQITVQYDAASSMAPLTGARLVAGNTRVSLSQPAGILTVTGVTDVALSPPPGGTPGTLSGAALQFAVVANSTTSGFLHCYDGTGPGGVCSAFFGTPSSNPIPQTGTGPFSFPQFNFSATAGVGDFVASPQTATPQPSVTTVTQYIGREISRVWVPDAAAPMLGSAGTTLLLTGMLFSGWRNARRRRG